ncbi:substrate-binding domain-containing protein [Myxococcus sp. RHSTA-1-4]|uniref:substrate-binding domain-containing protein n=1 Tax=Myxococcus sp. RHSTA-1-4 TaxID=2874601 RepID=UPI001CBAC7F1|nr:substrate-binding domain-containing protein [Myxococcus sp. RHSTA-1-4]MBZ4421683.1 substrate-binding domain-containing protein [Myxococcus sp. RHSTA-1-4]
MRISALRRGAPCALAVLTAALAASSAHAQTNPPTISCPTTNVVYVAGSSAVRSFLTVVAPLLAQDTPAYSIVYQSQGSCTGVTAIFSSDPSKRVIKDIPASGSKAANYAILLKADGTAQECSLPPEGVPVDVGVSDVYASTCGAEAPAGVQISDYEGPIQPMTFVVPVSSTQRSISAEAAYMAFGMGGNQGRAAPWVDPALFFVRNASSGTQQMIARAISVPADKWWGVDRGGSDGVRRNMSLLDTSRSEQAIGILSTDVADEERASLRILAFQARGQKCGFLPDSTPFARDKANVRDGHYPIWGPVHFYTRVENGLPSQAAGALVSRFAAPQLAQPLLEAIINKHLVPKCAMRVRRTTEMGPLSPVTTGLRCGCFFDKVANGATSCTPCAGPGDCPSSAPSCNYGFCEQGG